MAFSRRLGVIGILGASWLVAVGCGSDDDKKVNSTAGAGEGGEASGGTPSSGGSNSNAGKGGMVIVVGGEGGSAVAGTAGTGGSGGTAGSGGTTADAGAAGMAGAGAAAGAGGDGGAAGGGNVTPVVAKQCHYQCEIDADCKAGIDESQRCNPTTKRCEDPMTSCTMNDDCLPFGNFLAVNCTSAAVDCNAGSESCVLLHGQGWCVPRFDVETGCTQSGGEKVSLPNVGLAGNSNVCLDLSPRCNAGTCIFGCAHELLGGCDSGVGDTCNPATGLCECAASTECTADGVSACGADSHCGCNNAGDCSEAGVPGQSTCVAGTCGCADATECPNQYANATALCE
jgi:hypothetical protein